MMTAQTTMLRTTLLSLLAISIPLVLCSCGPENAVQSRLSKLLLANDYTLYTPMRGDDYPGTMFVLSRNHKGRWTEFAVAGYEEAFDGAATFDPTGQTVEFADQLNETFKVSGSIGIEIFKAFVKPKLAYDYTKNMKITLKDPKVRHRMSTSRLAGLAKELSDDTKSDLKHRKEKGQLDNVYIVMETIRIEGFDISLTLKKKFKATIGLDKIKDLTNLKAEVDTEGDTDFKLSSDKKMLIGYKALRFPDTILGDLVSPESGTELEEFMVDASTLYRIKSK